MRLGIGSWPVDFLTLRHVGIGRCVSCWWLVSYRKSGSETPFLRYSRSVGPRHLWKPRVGLLRLVPWRTLWWFLRWVTSSFARWLECRVLRSRRHGPGLRRYSLPLSHLLPSLEGIRSCLGIVRGRFVGVMWVSPHIGRISAGSARRLRRKAGPIRGLWSPLRWWWKIRGGGSGWRVGS